MTCKKYGAIFLTALTLSACATPRYVTRYCLTPAQLEELKRQEPERVGDKLTGQAQDDFKIVSGSAIRLRSWGNGLVDVLTGCTAPSERP